MTALCQWPLDPRFQPTVFHSHIFIKKVYVLKKDFKLTALTAALNTNKQFGAQNFATLF